MRPVGSHAPDHSELLRSFRQRVRDTIAADLAREAAEAERLCAQVVPRVAAAVERARAEGRCGRAWLFGSFAWGGPTERSDVDLMVEGCGEPDGLAGRLWRDCGRAVHVVEREHAPEGLVERVLAEGVAL